MYPLLSLHYIETQPNNKLYTHSYTHLLIARHTADDT